MEIARAVLNLLEKLESNQLRSEFMAVEEKSVITRQLCLERMETLRRKAKALSDINKIK